MCGHLYEQVRCLEPEAELCCQDLLGLADPAREGEHQGSLVNQLALVGLIQQSPLHTRHCKPGDDVEIKRE